LKDSADYDFALKKFNEPLQFGVFLTAGGLVALFWGSEITEACSMLLR